MPVWYKKLLSVLVISQNVLTKNIEMKCCVLKTLFISFPTNFNLLNTFVYSLPSSATPIPTTYTEKSCEIICPWFSWVTNEHSLKCVYFNIIRSSNCGNEKIDWIFYVWNFCSYFLSYRLISNLFFYLNPLNASTNW